MIYENTTGCNTCTGVITYILLDGYPPFHDDNQKALFRKIKKGDFEFHEEYWGSVSEEAKDLIRGMLRVNAEERLTVDQVLTHKWVRYYVFIVEEMSCCGGLSLKFGCVLPPTLVFCICCPILKHDFELAICNHFI